jgi:hypothetical protein
MAQEINTFSVDSKDDLDEQGSKKLKTKKNPFVDTSFLPDKERDEAEQRERYKLKLEWLKEQERIKGLIFSSLDYIRPLITHNT